MQIKFRVSERGEDKGMIKTYCSIVLFFSNANDDDLDDLCYFLYFDLYIYFHYYKIDQVEKN